MDVSQRIDQLNIRITKEKKDKFLDMARVNKTNGSQLIMSFIDNYLEKYEGLEVENWIDGYNELKREIDLLKKQIDNINQ